MSELRFEPLTGARPKAGATDHREAASFVQSGTQVLRADLTWCRADELRAGDGVVSFDEETVRVGNANGGRKYRHGVVLGSQIRQHASCEVSTAQGTVTTSASHLWLVRRTNVNRGPRLAWVPSAGLEPDNHRIISLGVPWEAEDTRIAGWLAGVLDADGHAFAGGRSGSWVGFGQVDGAVLDLFLTECERRGWPTSVTRRDWTKRRSFAERPKDFTDIRITGGMWASCRVLGTLRPERLLPRAAEMWNGSVVGKTTGDVEVLSIQHVGDQPMTHLTVDARTYVADGLLSHDGQHVSETLAVS